MKKQQPGYGPPTPVPIFQWEKEFSVLLELYRRIKPRRVLEVGTYHGGTLYHWLQHARKGARIVSLDSYAVGVDNRHLYEKWTREDINLEVVEGDCHAVEVIDFVRTFGPYDWVFIDAGHYLNEVTEDWANYGPMVRPGGWAIFHDILPPNDVHPEIEVAHLWKKIRKDHLTLEIINDTNATWGGIGIVLA